MQQLMKCVCFAAKFNNNCNEFVCVCAYFINIITQQFICVVVVINVVCYIYKYTSSCSCGVCVRARVCVSL